MLIALIVLVIAVAVAAVLLVLGNDYLASRFVVEVLCRPGFWFLRALSLRNSNTSHVYSWPSLLVGSSLWAAAVLLIRAVLLGDATS